MLVAADRGQRYRFGMVYRCSALALAAVGLAGVFSNCRRPTAAPVCAAKEVAPHAFRAQMDWFPQPEQGGVYQAAAKGFYREAGLNVEVIAGGPGRPILTGLLAGQAEVEIAESLDVILRVQQGLPVVMFGAVMEHDPLAVMVHQESPVRGFADLNRRRVMALPGTYWTAYVKEQYHIDFAIVPMNFSLAQFMADPNFVQQCFITSEPFFVAQHGQRARTLLIADSGYDPYRVYVTTRKVLRERPTDLRAFLAASIRGWDDLLRGDPAPAKKLIHSLNPQMSDGLMDYSIAEMGRHHLVSGDAAHGEHTGLITAQRLQKQIDLLVRMKALPAALAVDAVASFAFLPSDLRASAK